MNKAGFLNVHKRFTQLKSGQVFKSNNKNCPQYLTHHFQKLNEIEGRPETRGKAHNNFELSKISSDASVFTAIKDWNDFPSSIKDLKAEKTHEEKVKKHLVNMSNKEKMTYLLQSKENNVLLIFFSDSGHITCK